MTKPLEKIKKIRSFDEILIRGGQAISAYREQKRGGVQLPSDAEFFRLIDRDQFGKTPVMAETLWQRFFKNAETKFFPSFADHELSVDAFTECFGPATRQHFIAAADEIVEGRIDLFGLKGLYFGGEIDWHREPLSAKRSPLKHWKEFDDLDSSETGNKKIVWELNRHQHFFTLGVAFWLTGDERYAKAFVDQLESWMDQNPPGIGVNWSSSLEVAFRAMSWIWAFNFFRESDHFTPGVLLDGMKFLYQHGRHIEQYLSTYYSPNTHLTGEGLGLYYLGTQLPFFDRSKHWRRLGEDIMYSEITKQIMPDGVYFEQSTWYQRYTVDFYSHFVILRALAGGSRNYEGAVQLEERLPTAFDLLMNFTMPDGTTPLIGDDDGGRLLPLTDSAPDDFRGTLAVGAILFEKPDQKMISCEPSQEVFWLTGIEGINAYRTLAEAEPADESKHFENGGYCVMRDGWTDTDNCMLIDCGEIGSLAGGHGHADSLSIEVSMHGRSLLVDPGTYTYHDTKELRDHFRSSQGHNTITIDGESSSVPGNTFSWKSRAETRCDAWLAEQRFDFFEGSHDGYQRLSAPATHRRSVLFLKGDYWIMRDLVETSGEHEYALNFHFDHGVKTSIGEDGAWVGGSDHRLYSFGDNGFWEHKESWISKHHGNRVNAPMMRYSAVGDGPQEFFTFLMPAANGVEPPSVTEVPIFAGRAFMIKFNGYTDVFVFNDIGDRIDNGLFESNFKYSWARLSDGESIPEEFVLIDGNSLRIGSDSVFDPNELTFSSIRRLGSELYTKTDLGRSIRSLTQHI